jgi:hypothetical protein
MSASKCVAVRIQFELSTTKPDVTPKLDAYSLSFRRAAP